jgi:hypothetical protein
MYGLGMYVFFPSFIIEVDTATNCHLRYQPLGRTLGLADLDYVQPKHTPSASTTAATPSPPVTIEPDDSDLDTRHTGLNVLRPHQWISSICPLSQQKQSLPNLSTR